MLPRLDPLHLALFDRAIDKIREHPSYSKNLEQAASAQQTLILNYHTHGAGEPWCASICVHDGEVPLLGLRGELRELAHLRGVGRREEECEALMTAFAARLVARYELRTTPEIWLNGQPRSEA
jgi:hypothetical protein